MCERTCPNCRSTDHAETYGLIGHYIMCTGCFVILANRRDIDAAPINLTEDEAEAWQRAGTFVLPGAEAVDPADDEPFTPTNTAAVSERG